MITKLLPVQTTPLTLAFSPAAASVTSQPKGVEDKHFSIKDLENGRATPQRQTLLVKTAQRLAREITPVEFAKAQGSWGEIRALHGADYVIRDLSYFLGWEEVQDVMFLLQSLSYETDVNRKSLANGIEAAYFLERDKWLKSSNPNITDYQFMVLLIERLMRMINMILGPEEFIRVNDAKSLRQPEGAQAYHRSINNLSAMYKHYDDTYLQLFLPYLGFGPVIYDAQNQIIPVLTGECVLFSGNLRSGSFNYSAASVGCTTRLKSTGHSAPQSTDPREHLMLRFGGGFKFGELEKMLSE